MIRIPDEKRLYAVYGEAAKKNAARYVHLSEKFEENFGYAEAAYFSSPGRTEIIGNHVDHNGGKILAGSIDLDTICAAAPSDDGVITLISESLKEPVLLDPGEASQVPHGLGTRALLAGMVEAFRRRGIKVGGFKAYITTQVIPSAGVSSSASFEMLICQIMNDFFAGGRLGIEDYARIGQYAENEYWEKGSGLMDQMACAAGGTILLDFADGIRCEKVNFSFDDLDYDLILLGTGKGHADLTADYSFIPKEMHEAARALGGKVLCEFSEEDLLRHLPQLRKDLGNDRALLRAIHYFEEVRRVEEVVDALKAGDQDRILELIRESGNSSWKLLQNTYLGTCPHEQSIPLALAMTEAFCRKIGAGVSRVHGGGFAGVIMAIIPKEHSEDYIRYMAGVFGEDKVMRTGIRQAGVVKL